MNSIYKIAVLIFCCCISLSVHAASSSALHVIESENMKLRLEQVADGLGIPWGMSFISGSEMLVTERSGGVRLLDVRSGKSRILKNIPAVLPAGQGGMLDVAVSPDYKNDGWIYFTYVKDVAADTDGATVLARAKLAGDSFIDWQDLLVTRSDTEEDYHFGSRIALDNDGHVYFGVGDRGVRANAQDLSNHAGSIMRLNLDGSVPKDNPYSINKTFLPEVWSIGHRNPQGLAFDAENNRLWEIEHGPRGGDEINLIRAGANYGWPVISYGMEYWGPVAVGESTHREGMEQPVVQYTPSIAPGSLLLYSAEAMPAWKGNLFAGALKLQHINRIVLSKQGEVVKEERLLEELDERIRALAQSPQGWLYFSTDSGKIYRIRP